MIQRLTHSALLVSVWLLPLFAQEHAAVTALKRTYSGTTSLELQFEHTLFWKVREKHEKKSGSLHLMPGDKFRLVIGGVEWVCNGATLWHYNKHTAQVIVRNLADVDLSMHPSRLITGWLDHHFTVTSQDAKHTVLSWVSPDSITTDAGERITLWIATGKNTLEKAVAVDKNGNENTYTIKKMRTGVQFPAPLFEFSTPKGVEVLDYRQ